MPLPLSSVGRIGIRRPWDRPGGAGSTRKRVKKPAPTATEEHAASTNDTISSNYNNNHHQKDSVNSTSTIPAVTVDGISYLSDRFYLSTSEYDRDEEEDQHKKEHPDGDRGGNSTTTGTGGGEAALLCPHCQKASTSEHQHSLINVSRLVASLSLQAAIVGTFCLDTEWFLEHFPSLVRGDVPTLVLHGQRGGLDNQSDSTNNDGNKKEGVVLEKEDEENDDSSVDSMASEEIYTQPEETLAYAKIMANSQGSSSSDGGDGTHNDSFPPSTLHFTKVLTKWVPPIVSGVGTHASEFKQGVHHPKFFLLWETSGSILVVVSTGNLTPRRTVDGVWMQRFHPLTSQSSTSSLSSSSSSSSSPSGDSLVNDFGHVLQNLLSAQTHAIQVHAKTNPEGTIPMTPYTFVRTYLKWDNLDPISSMYDYSVAQVHLVATVPGLYSTSDYGRQRVNHILHQLSGSASNNNISSHQRGTPWLPPKLLTHHDRLIIHPTSFGDWNQSSLTKVVQSYLGDHYSRDTQQQDALERLDIIWPTERFIQRVRSALKSLRPDKVATSLQESKQQSSHKPSIHAERWHQRRLETAAKQSLPLSLSLSSPPRSTQNSMQSVLGSPKPEGMPHERRTHGGYMFLSSTTFNKMDAGCLSRMVQWEPSHPIPLSRRPTLVSHIKTIARVVGPTTTADEHVGDSKNSQKRPWYKARGVDGLFSWLLMTSACLSRGAQGESRGKDDGSRNSNNTHDESVSYANFELGVLFCSRLQHKPTDRIYCWKESRCTCCAASQRGGTDQSSSGSSHAVQNHHACPSRGGTIRGGGPRMIALPIPYRLDAARYQLDDDDLEFTETPYFHEITPSDCAVGNMRITPFGDYVARKRGDD